MGRNKQSGSKLSQLTNRELDIMKILWNAEKPMTALEICHSIEDTTMNTIQAVLRKLLRTNYIAVADIVYSGTVLCRSYKAAVTSDTFALAKITDDYQTYGKTITKSSVVAALLDSEGDAQQKLADIKHMEKLLAEYKKNL